MLTYLYFSDVLIDLQTITSVNRLKRRELAGHDVGRKEIRDVRMALVRKQVRGYLKNLSVDGKIMLR
jgi:hypothetical protein